MVILLREILLYYGRSAVFLKVQVRKPSPGLLSLLAAKSNLTWTLGFKKTYVYKGLCTEEVTCNQQNCGPCMVGYSGPPLIRTPLLPNNCGFIEEGSFGEENYMYPQHLLRRICVLSRGVASLDCVL